MAIVFKTPKSTLNTTSKQIQNVDGNCPPCPEPVLEGKELNYTQNGEYTVTPEQGVDGFSSIDVTVNVPSDVNNQNKTVSPSTSSQSVSADSGYTGLGTVTVNPVTSSIDANIQPENILSGVTILGVSGTDEGYDAGYTDGETAGHSAGYAEGEADGIVEGIAEQKAKLSSANFEANGIYRREDGWNAISVSVPATPLSTKTIRVESLGSKTFTPEEGGYSSVTVIAKEGVDCDIKGTERCPFTSARQIEALQESGTWVYPYTIDDSIWIDLAFESSTYNYLIDSNNDCILTFNENNTAWPEHRFIIHPFVDNGDETYGWPENFEVWRIGVIKATQRMTGVWGGIEYQNCNVCTYGIYNVNSNGHFLLDQDGVKYASVLVDVQPDLQAKTVNPSTSQQYVLPDSGKDGLSSVTVNAVTNAIDANIQAGNIKDGVSILGVTGNYSGSVINNQNKTVAPSTSQQSVSADQGYTGLGTVTVNAVTASIDQNIQAENILSGVTILGVEGTDLGYDAGEADGYQSGYDSGYSEGYSAGQAECPTPTFEQLDETITENGSYNYSPEADGFDAVDITVNVQPDLETKTATYVANNTYTITPTAGKDGISQATITVNVPSDIHNQNKTVSPSTSQQTVTADNGYSGLGTVTVNAVTAAIDPNIQAENILSGVNILGVDGTNYGYDTGYNAGVADGYQSGYSEGHSDGYTEGYSGGYDEGEADGVRAQKAKLTSTTLTSNGNYTREDGWNSVTVAVPSSINNQNKTINPSTSQQNVTADSGYSGLGMVTVNAVTAAIDANIVAENILDGVTILGVTGTDLGYDAGYSDGYAQGQAECPEPGGCENTALVDEYITANGTYTYDPSDYQGGSYDAFNGVQIAVSVEPLLQDDKVVTPSTIQQEITNDEGYYGLGTVTVNAVTSAIDQNIVAGNIKDGVTILGVLGTYTGGSTPVAPEPVTITVKEDLVFHYLHSNSTSPYRTVEYSTDGGNTWGSSNNFYLNLDAGDTIKLRGINDSYYGYKIVTQGRNNGEGRYDISGDITSLLNYTNYNDAQIAPNAFSGFLESSTIVDASGLRLPSITTDSAYYNMFRNSIYMTAAPVLPAKVMTTYCYSGTFYGCTNLTTAPALPATILANGCYNEMFYGCTSLTTAPSTLPARTVPTQAYKGMFKNCTSLVTPPTISATAMYGQDCCGSMFQGCSSLVTAPALPATTLVQSCYDNMFTGCTSLVNAPALPANKLAYRCYNYMFYQCTSLTTAPELSAGILSDQCYKGMFSGCTNLNEVTCLAVAVASGTTLADCTNRWLDNVAASGTFYKNANSSLDFSSVVPSDWTITNAS